MWTDSRFVGLRFSPISSSTSTSGSWSAAFERDAPLIRVQEQTKDAARLDFPPDVSYTSPRSHAAMTHSNRAAFFHLSLLVAERRIGEHLSCHCSLVGTCLWGRGEFAWSSAD